MLFELAHQRLRIADERDKILTSGKSGLPSRGKRMSISFTILNCAKVVSGLELRYYDQENEMRQVRCMIWIVNTRTYA